MNLPRVAGWPAPPLGGLLPYLIRQLSEQSSRVLRDSRVRDADQRAMCVEGALGSNCTTQQPCQASSQRGQSPGISSKRRRWAEERAHGSDQGVRADLTARRSDDIDRRRGRGRTDDPLQCVSVNLERVAVRQAVWSGLNPEMQVSCCAPRPRCHRRRRRLAAPYAGQSLFLLPSPVNSHAHLPHASPKPSRSDRKPSSATPPTAAPTRLTDSGNSASVYRTTTKDRQIPAPRPHSRVAPSAIRSRPT